MSIAAAPDVLLCLNTLRVVLISVVRICRDSSSFNSPNFLSRPSMVANGTCP